ncbi:MAG: hypothetical protein KAH20_07615 [Methylococcales bacterium]|nr:hypothetical protein [Methylococcales bacterium]
MLFIKFILACLLFIFPSSVLAVDYHLPHNQWRMVSLPAAPPLGNNTVEQVFGDDFGAEAINYGQTWKLYLYDRAANKYELLVYGSPLEQGQGYWIIQQSGNTVTLDLPNGSVNTPNNGEINLLPAQGGAAKQWSLVGNPFSLPKNLSQFSVKTSNGICSAPNCDFDNASTEGILHKAVWRYTGSKYQQIEGNYVLNPWDGFWSAALGQSNGLNSLSLVYSTNQVYPPQSQFTSIPTDNIIQQPPAYLASYVDPEFGTLVTRATDRANQNSNAHPYPKQGSAWNSDMTLLKMQYRLYDANSFQEIPLTLALNGDQAYSKLGSPTHGPADMRWSKKAPNVMYVLDSSKRFKKMELNAGRTDMNPPVILHDFSNDGYSKITTGNNEGNLDYNDEYIVFAAQKVGDERVYAVLYEISTDTVKWEKLIPYGLWNKHNSHPDNFDWITISPYGDYIVVSTTHRIYVYDKNFENEFLLASSAAHGDIGINQNGEQVYVQFVFSGEQGIWSYNLKTKEKIKLLPSKYNGGHISCKNIKRPGWCYVNTSQESYKEVFALKLDKGTGTVERFAQTHGSINNRGCTQVNVSPDGTKVLFSSDWSLGSAEDYAYDKAHKYGCGNDPDRKVKIDTYHVTVNGQ